jgi:hypothetical protein
MNVWIEDDGTLDTVIGWECECGARGKERFSVDAAARDDLGNIEPDVWEWIEEECAEAHAMDGTCELED